eukprot:scaffold13144_cov116-Isochrysis_galbana.AAC.1
MAVVTQEPPPGVARVKIPAQSMNQRIFTILLSSIAGVDAQPDTLDKGPYGPWFYLMEQYAAEQLALFATNNPLYYYEGENKIHIKIECRKILDDANNRRNATSSSNNNSIPRQLIESSLLHIIVRVYSPAEYVLIRLKHLANAFGDQLEFVKGNQQKNKVRDHASQQFVTVKSKAPIWHLYLSPKVGKQLRGMILPGFIEIDTPFGKIRLKYIVRPNSELMENDKMIICEGP